MGGLRAERAQAPRHLARASTHRGRAAPAAQADGPTARRAPRAARSRARSAPAPTAGRRRAHDARAQARTARPARAAPAPRASSARPARRPAEPSGTVCHGPSSVRHQAVEPRTAAPGLQQAQRRDQAPEGDARLRQRRRLARARLHGQHHERVRLVVLAAAAPHGLGRRVDTDRRARASRRTRAPSARPRWPRRPRGASTVLTAVSS